MIFFYRLLLYGDINQGIIPKESLQTNYMYSICFIIQTLMKKIYPSFLFMVIISITL